MSLTTEEKQKLEGWVRRPKTAQRFAPRARIVLKCSSGIQNQDVPENFGSMCIFVGKWRERFRISRLESG
jgi:hypothetical protein